MPKKRREESTYSSEMWKRQKIPSNLSRKDIEDVEVLFRKRLRYSPVISEPAPCSDSNTASAVEDWIGVDPTLAEQVSPDPELMALKQEVNATKDQLSSKDIETWHEHTTKCNIAGRVIPHVKSLGVELCTQAWVKFYEILSAYQIVPNQDFLSVHLCEAPGAFITSLNHYLQQHEFTHTWDWRATTLHPYYEANTTGEMIADDRLIRNTYSQWFFGRDGSGDITAENHVRDLWIMLQGVAEDEELPLLLVTADGSKDCQTNPAEQESSLTKLHYCEVIAACLMLARGGNFVLKVFTMFEPATVTLMFLLKVMFAEVNAVKPATSKSGNSEVYLVCMGFRKNIREETLWKLLDLTVYPPADFIQEHHLCCESFARWQMQTIKLNMELFESLSPEVQNRLQEMQAYALKMFIKQTGICRIHHYRQIAELSNSRSAFIIPHFTRGQSLPHTGRREWYSKNLKGTFHLRQNLSSMPWQERIKLIEVRENPHPDMILQLEHTLRDEEVAECMDDAETGNAFSVVENSRLCDIGLMKDLNLLLRHSKLMNYRQQQFPEHVAQLTKTLSTLVAEPLSGCQQPVIYWVGGKDEVNSLLYKSFSEMMKNKCLIKPICTDNDFMSLADSSEQQVQVFCNVTTFCDDGFHSSDDTKYEELVSRRKFMELISKLLAHLDTCHRLILLSTAYLTRLNAGILYILARSFQTTNIHVEASLWLHQIVVLDQYQGACPALLDHLADTNKLMENEDSEKQTVVMEVVNFSYLLNDRRFVQFVTAYNNCSVIGFINFMLQHYCTEKSSI